MTSGVKDIQLLELKDTILQLIYSAFFIVSSNYLTDGVSPKFQE